MVVISEQEFLVYSFKLCVARQHVFISREGWSGAPAAGGDGVRVLGELIIPFSIF